MPLSAAFVALVVVGAILWVLWVIVSAFLYNWGVIPPEEGSLRYLEQKMREINSQIPYKLVTLKKGEAVKIGHNLYFRFNGKEVTLSTRSWDNNDFGIYREHSALFFAGSEKYLARARYYSYVGDTGVAYKDIILNRLPLVEPANVAYVKYKYLKEVDEDPSVEFRQKYMS